MTARVALVGAGVVGGRVARLIEHEADSVLARVVDPRVSEFDAAGFDVVVLAHPGPHDVLARRALLAGASVVSTAGSPADVVALTELHEVAVHEGRPLVVGAAQSPGLSDLIARHLASQLERSDEIHIAVHGTAGPACAREHHRSLSGFGAALHDGELVTRRSGSGRELCWFPEPVGAYDCYRAELSSTLLLREVFPQVTRITTRLSANRRDRLTARLPMLTPPHREGGIGAVRVEVRGNDASGARTAHIAGVAELVGTSAAAVAVAFCRAALDGELPSGVITAGDSRLDTTALLHAVERCGVRLQEFTGIPTVV